MTVTCKKIIFNLFRELICHCKSKEFRDSIHKDDPFIFYFKLTKRGTFISSYAYTGIGQIVYKTFEKVINICRMNDKLPNSDISITVCGNNIDELYLEVN